MESWKKPLFPKPIRDEDRCLRSGPGKSTCTACQDVCPVPGFLLSGSTVTFPKDCISCHFCTAACPEGAIQGILPPPRLLAQPEIILRCERVYRQGVPPIACAGAVPELFLKLAAVQRHSILLVTGPCERCDRSKGLALFGQRIARVRRSDFLVWGHCKQPFNEVPERRRLLERLLQLAMSNRMRATGYWKFIPPELISDLNQVRPVITEQCIGCPVCEVVCPHHVFHREETDKGLRFLIVEKQCTGCMKCVTNCLFQGIKLESSSRRLVRTMELEKQNCPDCKEIFYGRSDACPRCRTAGSRGLFAMSGTKRPDVRIRPDS